MTTVLITLSTLLILLALADWALEHLCPDSAMRLAMQLESESKLMRRHHEHRHTFEHCPKLAGDRDYRVELHGPGHRGLDEPGLFLADSPEGPATSGTLYHRHFVSVPRDLQAVHHAGEPVRVTLEERDGEICVTELV